MVWSAAKWLRIPEDFRVMERYFSGDDPDTLVDRYQGAIDALGSGDFETWMDHAKSAGLSTASDSHFRNHWLSGELWPDLSGDTIVESLQEGFMAAMHDGRTNALPYNIVWVAVEGAPSTFFDVDHVVGANGVTVVIATAVPVTEAGA